MRLSMRLSLRVRLRVRLRRVHKAPRRQSVWRSNNVGSQSRCHSQFAQLGLFSETFSPTSYHVRAKSEGLVVLDLGYSLSDGGGWSKMKVSFSVSSQSILNRFS